MEAAHGGRDGEERQRDAVEGEDEGESEEEEDPECHARLAEECGCGEVGEGQEGRDCRKAEEGHPAEECGDGQHIVAARESARSGKDGVIHDVPRQFCGFLGGAMSVGVSVSVVRA